MTKQPARSGAARLRAACHALVRKYPVEGWWPARGRYEIMVGAVLVQNTRWSNVGGVIKALRASGCLEPRAMLALPEQQLRRLIRSAGCQSVKARRLRSLARVVEESGGLRGLSRLETARLRAVLLSIHGVGPETADAISCFAFDRPVFVADLYARRWLQRMGFVSSAQARNYAESQRRVNTLLIGVAIESQALHAGIVLHGQAVCGRVPNCLECFLKMFCKYYEKQ